MARNKNILDKKVNPGKFPVSLLFGLNLVTDNSLKRFANEDFIVEHTKKVDRKFASKK